MTKDELKTYIEDHSTELLEKDGSGKGYICPICGSGSGRNGTGITSKDGGKHFTCWAGNCFTNADILDILGLQYGLTDYKSKLEKAAELLHISLEGKPTPKTIGKDKRKDPPKKSKAPEKEIDYTDFFLKAAEDIEKTNYHRGLSLDILKRFHIGYVSRWKLPNVNTAHTSPRLIIPTSPYSYLARDTRQTLTETEKKYSKLKVGSVRIFNAEVLKTATEPVFIVEGEIDALSIMEVGGEAVALGSVSNIDKFLSLIELEKPSCPFIIALDNDNAGSKASRKLGEELATLGIPCNKADICSPYKDANEALVTAREELTTRVAYVKARALQAELDRKKALAEELQRESVYYELSDFTASIEDSKHASFYPTGFSVLDRKLDGGLYAGLYIVGAISSLGKTTFCLQIADQIAAKGNDVVIFSLEMAKRELIAKSVSRLTFTLNNDNGGDPSNAKTTRGILTGSRWNRYTDEEIGLITDAVDHYGDTSGKHTYIIEGVGNIGISEIRQRIEKHIKMTGKAPVVLIDYLQILAPEDIRATDKQNTDKAVLELKRMSRDYDIPVIGISSFNRDSYTAPVNLAAFKESGAIEYSSDVLIGLQYEGMDYQEGESDSARQKRIRQLQKDMQERGSLGKAQSIQVKILKNRNGSKGEAPMYFYPMFNCFSEEKLIEQEEPSDWKAVTE